MRAHWRRGMGNEKSDQSTGGTQREKGMGQNGKRAAPFSYPFSTKDVRFKRQGTRKKVPNMLAVAAAPR